MRKQDSETSTFHYYNANPKGKNCGDCTARAICTALNQPWEFTMREMTEEGIKYGYPFDDPKLIEIYLAKKGWIKHRQPRKSNNKKYTGSEFCKAHKEEICIANIGAHHIVAVIRGKVWDTWDSTDRCIGNYWTKGEEG